MTALVAAGMVLGVAAPATAAEDSGETYVIGTDTTFAPFEFTNSDGELVGIDMDLLRAIAEDQGFEVEIRQLGFDAALHALQSNQVDAVMAGMSITDERKEVFDFSDPYFTSGIQLGVLEASDIQSLDDLDDLDGKTVAVKTGTRARRRVRVRSEQGHEPRTARDVRRGPCQPPGVGPVRRDRRHVSRRGRAVRPAD